MAGVVPAKRSTSGRKQWTLHDGPTSSLKRLRSQLACDGCPESQVVLAKQLLDEKCDLETDKNENARLGVYWLMKASEQGHVEATSMLKKCFKSGKGITEHNYLDVKTCITMTQDEKLARKAAKEMFANLSNGEDFITSDQLQKHMLEIDKERSTTKLGQESNDYRNGELVDNYKDLSSESDEDTDWTKRCEKENEKITEENLVSAAVHYSHGRLPAVNNILCLSDPDLKMLDHIPFAQRSVLHPLLVLKILYYKLIRFLGRKAFDLKLSDGQFIVLVGVYFLSTTDNVLQFLPMVLYYVTFFIMVTSTFQMLQTKRDYQDFRVWSGLFISYTGGSLNAEEAEYQYIKKNLHPYGQFFVALLINLLVYPLIVDQWIPQSELTIIAFCFTFITLFSFMPKKHGKTVFDLSVLFSFAVNVIAKYPYETDPVVAQTWRFLDLKVPTFFTYVIGNGIEICINFRLLFYLLIPIIFIHIASKENWRATYKVLIPHSVTLSWLQIVVISSQGATMYGLLRGTLALVGFVVFLPLVGITSVILTAAALARWFCDNITYGVVVFFSFTLLGLFVCRFIAKSRYNRFTGVLQILMGLISFCLLLNVNLFPESEETNREVESISWDVFQKFCHQPAWENDNTAIVQTKCLNFVEQNIFWDGYVSDVKIVSTKNHLKSLIDILPSDTLRQYLYCSFGDEINNNCEESSELLKEDCLLLFAIMKSQGKCSLIDYDKYVFSIDVRMKSGMWGKMPTIVLTLENYFRNFTLNLKPEDHIWFKGRLYNNEDLEGKGILGGAMPHVYVEEIGCYACRDSKLTQAKIDGKEFYLILVKYFYVGVKFVLNVIFRPVMVIK